MQGVIVKNYSVRDILITATIISVVLIEVYAHTRLLYWYDRAATAVIYFVAGLSIALLPLLVRRRPVIPGSKISTYATWLGLLIIIFLLVKDFPALIVANPLDYKVSDMLPIMKVMAERFIDGQHVYKRIPEIWQGMQPIYLPAMWLPFVLSELMEFDLRWITLSFIILGSIVSVKAWDLKPRPFVTLIVFVPLFWLATTLVTKDMSYFIHTQEGIAVGYYLLLAFALMRGNPYLIGFSAALCLTSRFSFIFWLLAYGLYLLFSKDYRFFLKTAIVGLLTVVALMLFTGAYRHLDVFMGLQRTYLHAVRPNNEWKYSEMLQTSLGMARFWGYASLKELHKLFLIVNTLVPVLAFSIYLLRKRGTRKRNLISLCILKLSLVCFYNLILIPIPYLFYTSTFISIAILHYWLQGKED